VIDSLGVHHQAFFQKADTDLPSEAKVAADGAADARQKPLPSEVLYTSLVFKEYQDARRSFHEELKLALPFQSDPEVPYTEREPPFITIGWSCGGAIAPE
jgi:hypothetical protein